MNCDAFENVLPLYLEGNLKSTLLRNMEAHAGQCPACGALLCDLGEAHALLSVQQPTLPLLAEGFEERVMAGIRQKTGREPVRLFSIALCATSAVLLFFVLSGLLSDSGLSTLRLIYVLTTSLREEPALLPAIHSTLWPFLGFLLFMSGLLIIGLRRPLTAEHRK